MDIREKSSGKGKKMDQTFFIRLKNKEQQESKFKEPEHTFGKKTKTKKIKNKNKAERTAIVEKTGNC